jgi:hypothetical protein
MHCADACDRTEDRTSTIADAMNWRTKIAAFGRFDFSQDHVKDGTLNRIPMRKLRDQPQKDLGKLPWERCGRRKGTELPHGREKTNGKNLIECENVARFVEKIDRRRDEVGERSEHFPLTEFCNGASKFRAKLILD